MKYFVLGTIGATCACMGSAASAAPAATLLFTQPGSQIVNGNGSIRPAKRGDLVQEGERLLTPPGAISQIRLPDGSLVGLRPDTELKFDLPAPTSQAPQVVSLVRGTARVIGAELMDANKQSTFTLQSGPATLKLKGADLESALVRLDAIKPSGASDAGSYNRLLTGSGSISSGSALEVLPIRQVSFVGAPNIAPITLASALPVLFTPVLSLPSSTSSVTSRSPSPLAPSLVTSTLTTPVLTSNIKTPGAGAIAPTTPVFSPITTSVILQPMATSAIASVGPSMVNPVSAPVMTPVNVPTFNPVIVNTIITTPTLTKPVVCTRYIGKTCV
jgi:hypothetical protein